MITEDFVSFEVAQLLKEKGFDEPIWTCYEDDNEVIFGDKYNWNNSPMGHTSAPTHQMAMKWLREVHNIGIFPSTYTHISDRKVIHSYGTAIINLKTYKLMTDSYLSNDTYEQACEAAIKYCLENLI